MTSRLDVIECAGFTFGQTFLRRLYFNWQGKKNFICSVTQADSLTNEIKNFILIFSYLNDRLYHIKNQNEVNDDDASVVDQKVYKFFL